MGVCAKLEPEWNKRGVKILALSCNGIADHEKWLDDIAETQGARVNFPVIADSDRYVAKLYDMLDSQDPENVDKVRFCILHY